MASGILAGDVESEMDDLISALYNSIPSGVGTGGGARKVEPLEMDQVLVKGASWAVGAGYGRSDDSEHLEEDGAMEGGPAPAAGSDEGLAAWTVFR
jgi:tRNA-splicing ligase RtcB